jgi:hypothetical protein
MELQSRRVGRPSRGGRQHRIGVCVLGYRDSARTNGLWSEVDITDCGG